MIYQLAVCFPNCTPPPGSHVDLSHGSNAIIGAGVILIVIFLLMSRKGGK